MSSDSGRLPQRLGRMWQHPREQLERRGDYTMPMYCHPQGKEQSDGMGGFRLVLDNPPEESWHKKFGSPWIFTLAVGRSFTKVTAKVFGTPSARDPYGGFRLARESSKQEQSWNISTSPIPSWMRQFAPFRDDGD